MFSENNIIPGVAQIHMEAKNTEKKITEKKKKPQMQLLKVVV